MCIVGEECITSSRSSILFSPSPDIHKMKGTYRCSSVRRLVRKNKKDDGIWRFDDSFSGFNLEKKTIPETEHTADTLIT